MDPSNNPIPPGLRIVVCIQSGLPEYEGRTFIGLWGAGYGATLHEVIVDIVKRYPDTQKNLQLNPDGTATDWGFPLRLLN